MLWHACDAGEQGSVPGLKPASPGLRPPPACLVLPAQAKVTVRQEILMLHMPMSRAAISCVG